ncbi:unnamed protein product [Ilex paraguariensis]|uniref:Uncharacterized protein n=1 Tax=Ilex paraguariensis TaxID=185542 RepID=A0ABC8T806_9AQUA
MEGKGVMSEAETSMTGTRGGTGAWALVVGAATNAFGLTVRNELRAETGAGQVVRDDGDSATLHPRRRKYRRKMSTNDGGVKVSCTFSHLSDPSLFFIGVGVFVA